MSCGYSSGGKSTTHSVKMSGKNCKSFFKKTTSSLIKESTKLYCAMASANIRKTHALGRTDASGSALTGLREKKPDSVISRSIALSGMGSEREMMSDQ